MNISTTTMVYLQAVSIPLADGVLNEILRAVDSPRALFAFNEIVYALPACSVSCVEVDDGLKVTLLM